MFLLLVGGGAIVNVAVAWGVLFKYTEPTEHLLSHHQATAIWDRLPLPWQIAGTASGREERHPGWRTQWIVRPDNIDPMEAADAQLLLSGWPCNSMRAIDAYWKGRCFDEGCWERPDSWPLLDVYVLPTKAIWPGFAINTVFYAAVLWVLFAAPFALRKWRRIRRGRCPKCGYDLRGGAPEAKVCPECGNTLNRGTPATTAKSAASSAPAA
jgi:hypothetical protein